jgi:sulfide:quinone oxidoreductase
MNENLHHKIVIVGGGTAGVTVAARLRRAGEEDVALIEPSSTHWYQPLWTLVGGGVVDTSATRRPMADVLPRGIHWIQDRVTVVDPDAKVIETQGGVRIGYDFCVMAPGIELNWEGIPGLAEAVGHDGVVSNYTPETATQTWRVVSGFKGGTAVFTQPDGPIKCGGAPQKAAYMSADYFRRAGVLDSTDMIFATPSDSLFGMPDFRVVLEGVASNYGIDVAYKNELIEVRSEAGEAVFATADGTRTVNYDMLHVVPTQRAPEFVRKSKLAIPEDTRGYIDVDRDTLQHTRYPEVFALGDASGAPNAKTGAAVRKQAPVVVENLIATMEGRPLNGQYNGYSSCPIVTAKGRVLLAEFDYDLNPHKTVPVRNAAKERRDMWLLKRYGLPFMYWNLMLKGLA